MTRTRDFGLSSRANMKRAFVMRITRVANQKTLIKVSFKTKKKASQSQMRNNSVTKWQHENPRDIPNAFLESFIHTNTAHVMQKATWCTQNAACTTSREATNSSTIAETASAAFSDQEMHLLRLRWVQNRRIEGLFSVLLASCSC